MTGIAKRSPTVLLFLTVSLLMCACQAGPGNARGDGWISLFNGEDLTGWTPKFVGCELGENYNNTFRVEDDVLKIVYDDYAQFDGKFGHLFYEHEYAHYILRLEYRFVGEQIPGAPGWAYRNNGVMIHGQPAHTMSKDQAFPVSVEVQLLGGDGTHERATGNVCTPGTHIVMNGELIARHCIDSTSPTIHGDEWVALEIEVHGSDIIRHRINGELVMEYAQPQLDPSDADAKAWIERRGGEMLLDRGTISLQAESHPCEFRSIELLPLDD
ncbi:MAG: DUF1080 domain-containing protein [Phycisphaerales bacterium]|nr:DUF1080 domain-containing protein [Phycisphaerales bacterium]